MNRSKKSRRFGSLSITNKWSERGREGGKEKREREGHLPCLTHSYVVEMRNLSFSFLPSFPSFPPFLLDLVYWFIGLFVLARLLNVGNVVKLFMLKKNPRSVVFMGK